jgi:hypothetical protein
MARGTQYLQIAPLTEQTRDVIVPGRESSFRIHHWFNVIHLNVFRGKFVLTHGTEIMLS